MKSTNYGICTTNTTFSQENLAMAFLLYSDMHLSTGIVIDINSVNKWALLAFRTSVVLASLQATTCINSWT